MEDIEFANWQPSSWIFMYLQINFTQILSSNTAGAISEVWLLIDSYHDKQLYPNYKTVDDIWY